MTEQLTDRRRRLVRDEFARVAIALFAEHGFDNVTVDDIAAAAGSSRRTLFRYFPTKDAIVLDYEGRLMQRLVEALRQRPASEDAVVALRKAFEVTSHVEPADRERVMQHGKVLAASPTLRSRAQGERFAEDAALVELVAARLGAPTNDMRARVIVTAMTAVATQEFWTWRDNGGDDDPAARIAEALGMIERGLTALVDHDKPEANR